MDLEQRCKEAGIILEKEVGEEKWRRKVVLRRKYKWFFKIKMNIELIFLNWF
jgi:hypothetical protein